MEYKFSKVNSVVAICTFVIMFCTLFFTIGTMDLVQLSEYKNKNQTVTYQPYKTPKNLSKDNEREDIVKWARAQKDYAESKGAPITAFHAYYGKKSEAWCQMYVNWCSEMAGIPASGFKRESFACAASYKAYKNIGGVNRTTTSTTGIRAGWLVYEKFGGSGGEPNHVGLYTGNSWMHGNYNNGHVREKEKNYGNLIGYAKPYYRSKVYFNTNKKGASMKGYVYPKEYSVWYTEEKQCSLSTKGLVCSGYSFDGWYTDTAYTTKKTHITNSDYGPIRVYAKWKLDGSSESQTGESITDENKEEQNTNNVSVDKKDNVNKTDNITSSTINKTKVNNKNKKITVTETVNEKKDKAKKTVSTLAKKVKKEMLE